MNRAFVGCCGSGKTFTLQEAARHAVESSGWSFLVLDVNGEWPHKQVWRGYKGRIARVRSADAARRKLAEGARLVTFAPSDAGLMSGAKNPYAADADALARVAIEGGPTVLVIPEAWGVAREGSGPLRGHLAVIAHKWRHKEALIWFDTQNPADVSKELFKACSNINWFAVGGWNDYAVLRAISREAEPAAIAITEHAEPDGNGCKRPGWHLRIQGGVCDGKAYRVTAGRLEVRDARALASTRKR